MKLQKSPRKGKKWEVVFDDGKRVSFGAIGYDDYTTLPAATRDENKARYLKRHAKEGHTDPRKPGTLARYILWNLPTIEASFRDYKRKFFM
jgi:hypothetical protein